MTQGDPPDGQTQIESVEGLTFSTCDVSRVATCCSPLVASCESEFSNEIEVLDIKTQIEKLKAKLKTQLGVPFMEIDFFDEKDLTKHKEEIKQSQNEKDEKFNQLSARERNVLKRKQRAKKPTNNTKNDITSSSALKKRKTDAETESVVISHKSVDQLGVFTSGDEWPFEGLCEQLSLDLFSPKWEIRHGSAIGLKEILQIHASGSGKIVGVSKTDNQTRHEAWMEDMALRLLCVLSLDRFADFVGDSAVIPVRETCAMTLAVLMQHASEQLAMKVVNDGILKLIAFGAGALAEPGQLEVGVGNTRNQIGQVGNSHAASWEIRHASLIALKVLLYLKSVLDGSQTRTTKTNIITTKQWH
jgi:TATA-binding protein-associated factor